MLGVNFDGIYANGYKYSFSQDCSSLHSVRLGWGRFLRITFLRHVRDVVGPWLFNKSHVIYPGDHFANISLHAFQSLFSKVDFTKVAQ